MHKIVINLSSLGVSPFAFIFRFRFGFRFRLRLLHDVDNLTNGSEYRLNNEVYFEKFISVHFLPPFPFFQFPSHRQGYLALHVLLPSPITLCFCSRM